MQVKILQDTIRSIIEGNAELKFPDYQRAPAWSPYQRMMFIDSVLRGYSIPAFYFHYRWMNVPPEGEGNPRKCYDVIDGQQRIRAVREFCEGGFSLLDPAVDSGFRFPNFMRDKECAWAGKRYSELEELQEEFLRQPVMIYEITTKLKEEVMDLFIRLQGGTPLTPQDKRDAWPGEISEFVLRIGGKPKLNQDEFGDRYPGNTFFNSTVKGASRSNTKRRLAAQITMLHSHRAQGALCDIKSQSLDVFYHENIGNADFKVNGEQDKRIRKILDILTHAFPDARNLAGHEAIHLFLLVDSLTREYASGWERQLPEKLAEFRRRCKEADKAQKKNQDSDYTEYWRRYTRWTRTSSDEKSTIETRHEFFVGEMLHLLNPTPLDSNLITDLLREIIFYRDKRQCQWCRMKMEKGEINTPHTVALKDADIHHVIPRRDGGKTIPDNLALVARDCHPKGGKKEEEFHKWWDSRAQTTNADEAKQKKLSGLPNGTKCRFTYDEEEYEGEINGNHLVLPDIGKFTSFSSASSKVTNTGRNGWLDWEVQIPGEDKWILADDWRKGHE